MGVHRLNVADAIERLAGFDAVIDARSESEFAEDHLPGAVNWPVLSDAERHDIGSEYKQVSPFAARKRGAALVSQNIARHVLTHVQPLPQGWRPLVYCWRGGQRSGSLSLVLGQIGFSVQVLEGGYQAFRRQVLAELDPLAARLDFRVLCGRTGSAKSRLLQSLREAGAQVLDLEALACHRGSVLGPLPGQPQPSQKAFETALWQVLRRLDPARPVFAEGESRLIGRLRVPERLTEQLRAARCVEVRLPVAARVQFLLDDYAHFVTDTEAFCERLSALREQRGAALVARWQAQARAGALPEVVEELLTLHYDPGYARSMERNYAGFTDAQVLALPGWDAAALATAARALSGAG